MNYDDHKCVQCYVIDEKNNTCRNNTGTICCKCFNNWFKNCYNDKLISTLREGLDYDKNGVECDNCKEKEYFVIDCPLCHEHGGRGGYTEEEEYEMISKKWREKCVF